MVKKLKYLLFLFTFLFIIDVNASTVGGNQADSPVYSVVSTNYNNVPVRLWTPNIFGSDIVNYSSVVNDYVYITACTDMPTLGYSYVPFYNSTTGNTASATEIRYTANLTSKTCTFNTGAQGKVAYLKFRLISDLLNVPQGSSDTTWLYNDYITLYIGTNRAFSFSIQNISALDADLDIYSSDFDVSLLAQQNQQIINNQNNNTNSIINNQDSNTQDIINNQNSNTEKEIESQKVCNSINKSYVVKNGYYLNAQGTEISNNSFGITDYIRISGSTIKVLENTGAGGYFCYYDENKTRLSCLYNTNLTVGELLTIPTGADYVRFSLHINTDKPKFEICTNGNQALNDSVNNLNDTLKNDTPPDTENQLSDLDSSMISDTPITDLITLPITLLNSYITGFNGSCSPYNLGNLLGTDLILPCLNLEQRLGSNLWTIIDSLFSIYMIYNIAMLFIQAFEGFTSLRDDYEGLYQPRHADTGYQPKHGGGN